MERVPLLIIDDLGMRKLSATAAEGLLKVMVAESTVAKYMVKQTEVEGRLQAASRPGVR